MPRACPPASVVSTWAVKIRGVPISAASFAVVGAHITTDITSASQSASPVARRSGEYGPSHSFLPLSDAVGWLDGSGWQWRGGPKGDTIAILQSHGGSGGREGKEASKGEYEEYTPTGAIGDSEDSCNFYVCSLT